MQPHFPSAAMCRVEGRARMAGITERQQKCLEYVKQAQECGVSFAEFCRSHDLNLNSWYSIRLWGANSAIIA